MELCEANAEFLLVGGWAVILYGHVRATDDMDVFVRPSQDNSLRVTSALKAFGAPLAAWRYRQPFRSRRRRLPIRRGTTEDRGPHKNSGVSLNDAMVEARAFEHASCKIPHIGKRALIQKKKSAGRHKDLADVEELARIE